MNYNEYIKPYLCHHGILGMKWGVRRYQNPDGSLTEAGRKRYYSTTGGKRLTKAGAKEAGKDLAKLSKIALKEGYENYFGADYKKQLAYIQRKWGETADGMADWAGEHKGALDKADRILDKAQKRIDKERAAHDPFPKESNNDPNAKNGNKRMDRMADKYIKLSNKADDAILSGNRSLADKYNKKKDALAMRIVDEGDKLANKRTPNDQFSRALHDDPTVSNIIAVAPKDQHVAFFRIVSEQHAQRHHRRLGRANDRIPVSLARIFISAVDISLERFFRRHLRLLTDAGRLCRYYRLLRRRCRRHRRNSCQQRNQRHLHRFFPIHEKSPSKSKVIAHTF